MPEKIRRVRRKRRSRSLPGVESFPSFRLHLPPVRVALYVAAAAVAVLLIALFGTYSSKLYTGWRESLGPPGPRTPSRFTSRFLHPCRSHRKTKLGGHGFLAGADCPFAG